jgi:hypothetical protein
MFKLMDAYTLRARLAPAIIAAAPALAFVMLLISWTRISLSNTIATLGLAVILYALADFARRRGRRIEPAIFQRLGGKPSITMMRFSDDTFDEATKRRYVSYVAGQIGETAPSSAGERRDPAATDKFYDRCGAWLREHTRDAKKFSILFNENCTYGLRRNLFAMKWPALGINLMTVLVSVAVFWGVGPFAALAAFKSRVIIVFVVAAIHAVYIGFAVNLAGLSDAAKAYARQLILSCELLINPKTAPAKRKANPRKSANKPPEPV